MTTQSQGAELVYAAADAVMTAYNAVNRIAFGTHPLLDALLDRLRDADLDTLAKQLKAQAEEWQSEIDREDA